MATPEKLVFSEKAKAATASKEYKINEERKLQFEALIKEIESAKNFSEKYFKMSDEDFQKESASISTALAEKGCGAAIMIKRQPNKAVPGQAFYEFRRLAKIYAPGEDYGVLGIERFIIKLSCLELEKDKMVEIFEQDFFSDVISESNVMLYMNDGEVRLAYPNSAAGNSPAYKKMGL